MQIEPTADEAFDRLMVAHGFADEGADSYNAVATMLGDERDHT